MREDDYIGQQFTWYTGIIEDIDDPLILNRVKVRCIGFHSDDKGVLPTADLPWATVIMPNTAASYQGVGANHHLEVGSWVVGFFRDGTSAQDPMVMGSIATQENGVKDIPVESQLNPPSNKVYRSKAGHLIEIDNTEGTERINIQHKSGSYILFKDDGTIELNGNTKIIGTLHATKDISTDAGNKPTLATHKHRQVGGTAQDGDGPTKTIETTVADEGAPSPE